MVAARAADSCHYSRTAKKKDTIRAGSGNLTRNMWRSKSEGQNVNVIMLLGISSQTAKDCNIIM